MTKTGLLFGSFNPIHIGHLALANYLLEFTTLEELWFVVSPQNPFKEHTTLAPANDRLEMVRIATRQEPRFKVCNIEFDMPVPSYTIHTLNLLIDKYPSSNFSLIIGSDNLLNIDRWHDAEKILENFPILVYQRPGYPLQSTHKKSIKIIDAPLLDISSTLIREGISNGKQLRFLVPEGVYDYLIHNGLYF
jgi:nicotinate-nucleotide adenylyltransferase